MVASPNYERLKVFMEAARANKGLDAWDGDHDKALKALMTPLSTCAPIAKTMALPARRVKHGSLG